MCTVDLVIGCYSVDDVITMYMERHKSLL